MTPTVVALCESFELAATVSVLADEVGLELSVASPAALWSATADALTDGTRVLVATTKAPPDSVLAGAASKAWRIDGRVAIALLADEPSELARCTAIGADLGVPVVGDLEPLVAIAALWRAKARAPWAASTREIGVAERNRLLRDSHAATGRANGRWVRSSSTRLGWRTDTDAESVVGGMGACAAATAALAAARLEAVPDAVIVDGVDREAVRDILFGPERVLSGPASKAALRCYGVPTPLEEVCTSPSRAASEATRLGFPVRVTLASPDLRLAEHPDLVVDGVEGAAQVRDAVRQLTAAATARSPNARVLGVTVTAARLSRAMLSVACRPIDGGCVIVALGFADAHGTAARDATTLVLPGAPARIERSLGRLRAFDLIADGASAAARQRSVVEVVEILQRIGAFVHDWRGEVSALEVSQLALLVGGGVEVRDASVHVSDAFTRSLQSLGA